jgi:hypothetical protein
MTEKNSATQRMALALQAAGLTSEQARSAVEEVRAQILHELYEELKTVAEKKNPFRLNRARLKWYQGLNQAMDLVFRRMLQAETAARVFRRKHILEAP